MAYMYGILSVIGWNALVIVLAFLFLVPPPDSNDSDK